MYTSHFSASSPFKNLGGKKSYLITEIKKHGHPLRNFFWMEGGELVRESGIGGSSKPSCVRNSPFGMQQGENGLHS
jgi:hypothetical protein